MSGLYLSRGLFPEEFLRPTVQFILECQRPSGEIPWFDGGYTDPWDHVESAMGLAIGGEVDAARRAYEWLASIQLEDGSWWASYRGEEVDNRQRRETNFVAYFATGVWHQYLVTRDKEFLAAMWPTVDRAIGFVLSLQSEHGEIDWAVDTHGKAKGDALVTGCASIYKSLECAHNIAVTLDEDRAHWLRAREKLGKALRQKPERFDRTWESKARYSMDWFYPILAGVVTGDAARARLDARWHTFVEPKLGCRCVADQPWVTIAETCELTMACVAAGCRSRARATFDSIRRYQAEDGSWWTGYAFADDVMWPDERPTWTAGSVLLAADALDHLSPASRLFTSVALPTR